MDPGRVIDAVNAYDPDSASQYRGLLGGPLRGFRVWVTESGVADPALHIPFVQNRYQWSEFDDAHDAEGGEPDFTLPALPEWDDPSYVHWQIDPLGILPCHPIEVLDNMADVAHLGPTHGGPCAYFHNEIEGVVLRQRQGGEHRTLAVGVMLETDTFYTGPGVLLSYFNGGVAIMYIAHTPVDDGSIKAWHALLVKSPHAVPTDEDIANARAGQAGSLDAFSQDFEIWANKRPCINPLAVPADGPFAKVRMWYRQFYNERAKAAEFQARAAGFHTVKGMPAHNPRVA